MGHPSKQICPSSKIIGIMTRNTEIWKFGTWNGVIFIATTLTRVSGCRHQTDRQLDRWTDRERNSQNICLDCSVALAYNSVCQGSCNLDIPYNLSTLFKSHTFIPFRSLFLSEFRQPPSYWTDLSGTAAPNMTNPGTVLTDHWPFCTGQNASAVEA